MNSHTAVCWPCRRSVRYSDRQLHTPRCPECRKGMTRLGKSSLTIPARSNAAAWVAMRVEWERRREPWDFRRERAEQIGKKI